MSSLLYRIARACYRARLRVVAAWLALLFALGVSTAFLAGTFDDEFRIPGAASQTALDQLRMTFPEAADASATMLIVAADGHTVTEPAAKKAIEASLGRLDKISWVKGSQSPFNEYVKGLVSDDESAAYARIRVTGSVSTFTDSQREALTEAGQELQANLPVGSEVHLGGEVYSVHMPHLSPVEMIGLVVALFVLVFILRSIRGALMPVAAALLGAGLSILLIMLAAGLTPINSTTMMLALMLALAVGIDYSLFILSRHRDQLRDPDLTLEESAARATATAGSAVVFAGLTVIIALAGLAVAGIPFLTIMGLFASAAVAIEVVLAITLLPALMSYGGEKLRPKASQRVEKTTASHWWVGVVTKAPVVTVLAVVVALAALSVPAKDLQLALPNSGRSAPASQDRVTFDLISQRFGVGFNGPLVITGTIVESDDPLSITKGLKRDIERMDGVQLVAISTPNQNADTAMVQVIPTTGPDDPATRDLVERLRDRAPEWKDAYGIDTSVTGFTAVAIDVSDRLAAALLPFGVFVVGLSLVLLTVVFRSIVVPIKAALGYLLSVGGAFGATNLVFNRGWFKEVINLPEPLPVISFLPIILMGILFGLAMDYEVFLTSRMREEYVHGNRDTWVEEGFVHSAKVVVAAAIIMVAVFAFFVPAGEGVIKPIAFGLALGVAIDAFAIRMTLGPAAMKLLGDRAWWLPAWLERRMPVLDVEGEALAHQLSLADWPHPGSKHAVYAEGLAARADGAAPLFSGLDLDVLPGSALVVSGPAASRRALLLALTGRLRPSGGEAKILGLVLPEEAAMLRRRTLMVAGLAPDAARRLAGSQAELVCVDDADRLTAEGRAALADLQAGGDVTVVLGVPTPDLAAELIPAAVPHTFVEVPRAGAEVLTASGQGAH